MARKKETPMSVRVIQKYNALSPMMKLLFSSEAQLRYADDKSLMPILEELEKADRLAHDLLIFPYTTTAQAETVIRREIEPLDKKERILNYATNALVIGDAIVYRMAYRHGETYGSMNGFSIPHPMTTDAATLQRQVAFLKRMNRTDFSMKNPNHSKYYKAWSISSPEAIRFHQRRLNYTLAISDIMKEMGMTFRKVTLPYTGVGRAFIKEVSRQRN